MRKWIFRGLAGAFVVGLLAFMILPTSPAQSVGVDRQYYSLDVGGIGSPGIMDLAQGGLTPNCSTWHELYPNFCVNHHQDSYNDNGDGTVSPCDEIVLDGVVWHISWVGPTYYLTCYPPGEPPVPVIWEPNLGPHDPGSPVCETWEEVMPAFGDQHHVDEWADNDGSLNLSICDEIWSDGLLYHVDDIRLNIIVVPPGTPVEETTWGKLKSWLGSIGN
jgi:hypothetical protein